MQNLPSYLLSLYQIGKAEQERLAKTLCPQSKFHDSSPTLRYLAFSSGVLPSSPLFGAIVEGVAGNITSQIAVQMSLEAMKSAVLGNYDEKKETALTATTSSNEDISFAAWSVQTALKEANLQVYEYGHRMLAGGQLGATGMVFSFDGKRCVLGCLGNYSAFLWRNGELQSFYEEEDLKDSSSSRSGMLNRFIGANAQALVDLASVSVKDGDVVVLLSLPFSKEISQGIGRVLQEMTSLDEASKELAFEAWGSIFEQARLPLETKRDETTGEENSLSGKNIAFDKNVWVCMLQVGQPTIVLRDVVI